MKHDYAVVHGIQYFACVLICLLMFIGLCTHMCVWMHWNIFVCNIIFVYFRMSFCSANKWVYVCSSSVCYITLIVSFYIFVFVGYIILYRKNYKKYTNYTIFLQEEDIWSIWSKCTNYYFTKIFHKSINGTLLCTINILSWEYFDHEPF